MPTLFQQFGDDPLVTLGLLAAMLFFAVAGGLPLLCGKLYLVYFLLTLPLRRNERARFFLDLLEIGIKDGHSPERAIVNAGRSGDPMLGGKFHQLAKHLETGMKLSIGLELVPNLLPRPVAAMLRAGEKLGDVRQVIPACRQLLRDGHSQVRGALNYLLVLWFCATPVIIAVPLLLRVKVMPQFRVVFEGMGVGSHLPAFTQTVFAASYWFTLGAVVLMGLAWLALLCYVGGPRLWRYVSDVIPGLPDAISYRLPWRRNRLRRNFSSMFAVLLDANLPEPEAVRLAAESTDNRVLVRLATRVRSRLAEGVALPEALKALDDAGELHWRLANARPGHGGFRRALAGWLEALDARAFQQEQSAAQVATTSLVLFNGVIVAAFVFAIYLAIFSLIQEAALW
jgi:type II secretory pathway component PulF